MNASSFLSLVLLGAVTLHASEGDLAFVGQKAPEFTGTSIDGAEVNLDALQGKVVLINFFVTWDRACIEEVPRVEKEIWQKYKATDLAVIAIGREQKAPELLKFKKAKRLTFVVLPDPEREIYNKYAANKLVPRCYVVGKDGLIKYASAGFDDEEFDKMKATIADELKK